MSYCLNPNCKTPDNRAPNNFCIYCGKKLLLNERYRAIKPIGQGGFGKTFLGIDEHKPTKPPCVIKQFSPSSQGTNNLNKATELFNQEAVRLDTLGKHPQIPELFAHFEQDQLLYIVQEYVEGQNLAQELQKNGVLNETQIQDLLTQLLSILDFVHQNNVIHRDIKPENIIKRTDGKYVLVDFGAARYVTGTALLQPGTRIGDLRYMSGEQLQGKAVFASDLYSLGLTCLHLLTNIEPWDLFDLNNDKWVWRDYLTQSVNQGLGQILDKMIENAINKRFQSAGEILNIGQQKSYENVQLKPSKLENNKYGYIDGTGKVIIAPQFDEADDFYEGLAKIKINDKYGYIDHAGNIVINPWFDYAENFSDGLARVAINDKYGYINNADNRLIIFPFDKIEKLLDGLAKFKINDKYGCIDKTGKIVIQPQFDEIEKLLDGLAKFKINDKYDCIDKTAKIVIQPRFDEIGYFSNELARVKINGKYGFIDQTGKIVIQPRFDEIGYFSNELAKVKINGKYGFIDQTGKIVISPQFDEIGDYSKGLAKVEINGKYSLIDEKGERVIQPLFDLIEDFKNELAKVCINGKWGYIDQTGKIVIQPLFDALDEFSDGLAEVKINGKRGYIDQHGFSDGLARVKIDEKWGYMDQTGKIVIQPQFDKADDFKNGKAYVEKKEFWWMSVKTGYINTYGKWTN